MTKYNIWFFSSFLIALVVALPVITIFFSFFLETSNYFTVLKNPFLFDYINNSLTILISVLIITFLLGVISAYFISFYEFPLCNFFSWALILAFAIPGYIFAFSIIAWTVRSVNFLELIVDDGHSLKTYLYFSALNITNIISNKYHEKSNSPIEKYPFFIIFWVRVPKYLRCNFYIF